MPDEQKQQTKKSRPPKAKSAYALALQKVQEEQISQTEEQPDTQTRQEDKATQPANQQNIETANHLAIQTFKHTDIKTEDQLASKPEKQQRTKATYYLGMEDIIAIDTLQTQRYRAIGKKPEKSELVSEAIQLLFKQENS